MERSRNTVRAWVIMEDGKAALDTVRQFRPEAWEAWERRVRPDHGLVYDVKARRVRLMVEAE